MQQLLNAANYAYEALEDHYDGAPDSRCAWMVEPMLLLKNAIDAKNQEPHTFSSRDRVMYDLEKIIDHCRNSDGEEIPGWRMTAIREAARRIEDLFINGKAASHG